MAECPRCHAPIQPGAFTCSICGLHVDAEGRPLDPLDPPKSRRPQRRTLVVLAAVAAAAVAAFAVWFFVLRAPATSGDEFLGTWRAETQGTLGYAVITRSEGTFNVLLVATESKVKATVPARLDGRDLVLVPSDFRHAADTNARRLGLLLQLYAGDFRITLSSAGAEKLKARILGRSPGGSDVDERATLVKVHP